MITIAYMTNRRNPRFEWFADSLANQAPREDVEVVVIDFYHGERDLSEACRHHGFRAKGSKPKPTVWQGEGRLTNRNFFAAANARNTAICLARGDYIAFVDDVSVLAPTWYQSVQAAAMAGRVACGTYQKVKKMEVSEGKLIRFERYFEGEDARLLRASGDCMQCPADWFFGCSCGAPIQAMLHINGYPEMCDGMGYEDSETGKTLRRAGYPLFFYRGMKTFESEEAHHEDQPFDRQDYGVSPNDKSHALLRNCRTTTRFDNYFGDGGIEGLRSHVLAGGDFPKMSHPDTEWFTGRKLSEL